MTFGSKDSFAHNPYAWAIEGEENPNLQVGEWQELCVEPKDEWTVIPEELSTIKRC